MIDRQRPWAKAFGRGVILRNLRDPKAGADMRVDIALQGPKSRDILLALGCDAPDPQAHHGIETHRAVRSSRGRFRPGRLPHRLYRRENGLRAVRPPRQGRCSFGTRLMEAGAPLGLKPCGLGARDSLRTEAGLPLYGHEMGGELEPGRG